MAALTFSAERERFAKRVAATSITCRCSGSPSRGIVSTIPCVHSESPSLVRGTVHLLRAGHTAGFGIARRARVNSHVCLRLSKPARFDARRTAFATMLFDEHCFRP